MEDSVAIRLKVFMDEMGLSNSQFADSCGIPRPSLSQLLTGRNKKISDVIIGQIHSAYPSLSVLWLLFGEGPMLQSALEDDKKEASSDNSHGQIIVNATNESEKFKYSNLRALNDGVNDVQSIGNKGDLPNLKIVELQREIDKMRKNPRKVVQITVYYDDSTFETFIPGK